MKAAINNENKEKFFAQYWRQEVLCQGRLKYIKIVETTIFRAKYRSYLTLKPLSQISDEDGWEIVKSGFTVEFLEKGWRPKDTLVIFDYKGYMIDYLRSKGYALPWMGLSVEEMIDAGWIKLEEK